MHALLPFGATLLPLFSSFSGAALVFIIPACSPRREHYLPACLVNLWLLLPAICELDHRSKVFWVGLVTLSENAIFGSAASACRRRGWIRSKQRITFGFRCQILSADLTNGAILPI